MDDYVIEIIKKIKEQYSDDIFDDGKRLFSLFSDFLPDRRKELRILKIFCEDDILKAVCSIKSNEDLQSIIYNLKEEYLIDERFAREGLEWFVRALYVNDVNLLSFFNTANTTEVPIKENPINSYSNVPSKANEEKNFPSEEDKILDYYFERIKSDSKTCDLIFSKKNEEIKKIDFKIELPSYIRKTEQTDLDRRFQQECEYSKIYNKRNIPAELELAKKYSAIGSAKAYERLGEIYSYQYLYGPKVDINQAISYYLKAIELGGLNYLVDFLWLLKKYDYVQTVTLAKTCFELIRRYNLVANNYYVNLYEDVLRLYLDYEIGDREEAKEAFDLLIYSYKRHPYPTQGNLIGRYYYLLKKYDDAARYFIEGSAKYNVDSLCYLGVCYYYGLGVGKDYERAEHFFSLADVREDSRIYKFKALRYYYGEGVEVNKGYAVWYLSEANRCDDCVVIKYYDAMREELILVNSELIWRLK